MSHVLILGASSQIGQAIAQQVLDAGQRATLSYRSASHLEELEALAAPFGEACKLVHCDLDQDLTQQAFIDDLEPVDALVYNIGVMEMRPIRLMDQAHLERLFRINCFAPMLILGGLMRQRKINKKASAVFVSSLSAQYPWPGGAAYSASKAALENLVKTAAKECADKGLRCNAVAPGMVETRMFDKAMQMLSTDQQKAHLDKYPLGLVQPKDVADLVVFLLSKQAAKVTGTTYALDGGLLSTALR